MAHAHHRRRDEDQAINAINTTPLVDVMLVLLIIFLITVPVVLKTVAVTLPKERNVPAPTSPKNITIAVDNKGNTYWNNIQITSQSDLLGRMKTIAKLDPQPEIQVRGDAETRYEPIGRVILAIQRAGIVKVAFITEPPPRQ